MIFDHIRNRASYQGDPVLAQVLEYLAGCDRQNRPTQRVELEGNRLYVNPVELTTKPEEECLFEGHRRYADVHYILEGCEVIDVSELSTLQPVGSFDPAIDFGQYQGESMLRVTLHPGEFLVCYPQDAHKVAMMQSQPERVVKLVGKIMV